MYNLFEISDSDQPEKKCNNKNEIEIYIDQKFKHIEGKQLILMKSCPFIVITFRTN